MSKSDKIKIFFSQLVVIIGVSLITFEILNFLIELVKDYEVLMLLTYVSVIMPYGTLVIMFLINTLSLFFGDDSDFNNDKEYTVTSKRDKNTKWIKLK